jgi:hypothetical protein
MAFPNHPLVRVLISVIIGWTLFAIFTGLIQKPIAQAIAEQDNVQSLLMIFNQGSCSSIA